MITPAELKSRTFKKNIGGYNAAEIDAHLAELYENYEKIYSDNAELAAKNEMLLARVAAYREQENALKTAVCNVKLLCDGLIDEANVKSEKLVNGAMEKREEILSALETAIKDKKAEIKKLNDEITAYKDKMLFHYKIHFENINKLPAFELIDDKALAAAADAGYQSMRAEEVKIPIIVGEKTADPEISEMIFEEEAETSKKPEGAIAEDKTQDASDNKEKLGKMINEIGSTAELEMKKPPISEADDLIRKEVADFVRSQKNEKPQNPLENLLFDGDEGDDEEDIPVKSSFADDIRFGANYALMDEPPKKKGFFRKNK